MRMSSKPKSEVTGAGSESDASTCPASSCCWLAYARGRGNERAVMISFYRDSKRKYISPLLPDTIFRLSTYSDTFFPQFIQVERGREREGRGIERKVFKELIKIKSLLGQDVPSLCFLWGRGWGGGRVSYVHPRGKAS